MIEVDGDTHRKTNRYQADQSRDCLLIDAGFALVERIAAEDTDGRPELDLFVRRFLDQLVSR